jgi:hypothetical protein
MAGAGVELTASETPAEQVGYVAGSGRAIADADAGLARLRQIEAALPPEAPRPAVRQTSSAPTRPAAVAPRPQAEQGESAGSVYGWRGGEAWDAANPNPHQNPYGWRKAQSPRSQQ